MLFLLGTVIFAVDIANMMTAVTVGIALQKGRPSAGARSIDQAGRGFIYCTHVCAVDARGFKTEGGRATKNRAGCGFRKVSVFVVLIVFADVDDGQLPELRQ